MSILNREQLWSLARSVHPFAVESRRHLHRFPEVSFQEKETSAFVANAIAEMGHPLQTGVGGYGVKVVIEGGSPGPTIALRADIDALPIYEETGLEFASQNPGVMHACGHDVHTATLLATAKALTAIQADLSGRVVLVFQPGEEQNPGGASLMIKDGVLENPKVDAIFGLHVAPWEAAGTLAFGAGAKMAAPDEFDCTVRGKGGHGARPNLGVDPILVASQCITLLQQIVARNVDPLLSAVITVGSIHGGSARNVIPDEVTFTGTVRTMDPEVQKLMAVRIEQVIKGVCEAAGATYRLRYESGYPVLVNDAAATEVAFSAAGAILSEENVIDMPVSMGGEDFAFFLQMVPGSFGRLGSKSEHDKNPAGLHTSTLMIDEECMVVGVAYYLSLVQNYLGPKMA